jgi:hypothetical protein
LSERLIGYLVINVVVVVIVLIVVCRALSGCQVDKDAKTAN